MHAKQSALVVLIIGVVLLLASLTADLTGLGDDPGFGSQQTIGTIAGVVVALLGGYLYRKASKTS